MDELNHAPHNPENGTAIFYAAGVLCLAADKVIGATADRQELEHPMHAQWSAGTCCQHQDTPNGLEMLRRRRLGFDFGDQPGVSAEGCQLFPVLPRWIGIFIGCLQFIEPLRQAFNLGLDLSRSLAVLDDMQGKFDIDETP